MGKDPQAPRRGRGFRRAGNLVEREIREAGETRGFAVSKLLTHWAEVAGEAKAKRTRPVKVTYGRAGMGATLTVLTTGAEAPVVEMQKERLRERVNACYGYNAISRIRITQTAPSGFAEGAEVFDPVPADKRQVVPDARLRARAQLTAAPVSDPGLRSALENLGTNILSRENQTTGKS